MAFKKNLQTLFLILCPIPAIAQIPDSVRRTEDVIYGRNSGPVDRESSAVQAVTCFFPPTDFLNYGGPGIDGVGQGLLAPLQLAFGPRALTPEGRQQLSREISPAYYVSGKLPPTLIIHGDRDDVVPLQQAESFVVKAREAGAPHIQRVVRPGKGHGWGDFWKSSEDISAFADWFDRHLGNKK